MKSTFSKLALIAALAFTASATAAIAGEPTVYQLAPYGYAASTAASRVVTLGSESKSLNVTQLETVQLNVGGKNVVWTFDTLDTASFGSLSFRVETADSGEV